MDPAPALFGQWEIVSIDGREPDYNEMILLFGDDWWHIQSQCVWSTGDYRVTGGALDFTAITRKFENYDTLAGPARVMCARGRSEAEKRAPQVLAGVRQFTLEDGQLEIISADGNLVARPLEETQANPIGYTEFDAATTWGAWTIDSIEGEAIVDAEMVLTFDRITVRFGCRYYQWMRPKDAGGMYTPLVRRKPFGSGCDLALTEAQTGLLEAIDDIEFSKTVGPDGRIMQANGKAIRLSR